MGNPANYSVDLPSRCLLLLEQLWLHAETVHAPGERALGPLTSTFLISMSMPIINLPIERIERHRNAKGPAYANDRPIAPAIVREIDRVLGGGLFKKAPFFREHAWSFARCGEKPFPNIAHGVPPAIADQLASEDGAKLAAKLQTLQWCSILRNALAHGGVAYLDEDGRSSYGRPVRMFAFASGQYPKPGDGDPKQLVGVNFLRISKVDYFAFLRSWVAWLREAGIEHAMAS